MKSPYKIFIDEDAISDIHDVAAWYEKARAGLGERFKHQAKKQINNLKKTPFVGALRNETQRFGKIECLINFI